MKRPFKVGDGDWDTGEGYEMQRMVRHDGDPIKLKIELPFYTSEGRNRTQELSGWPTREAARPEARAACQQTSYISNCFERRAMGCCNSSSSFFTWFSP